MRKVSIIGSTLSGNKGAAAMLESSIQNLMKKDKNTEFYLFSYLPLSVENSNNSFNNLQILKASPLYLGLVINPLALFYRILPFVRPLLRKNKQIKVLSESDVLLDQGGITFVDGREKFLLYNVASILPALFMKVKVVKCAQALGPFNGRINRTVARIFLPKVEIIVARGAITYDYLKSLNLKNVAKGADLAFLLDVTKQEKKAAENYYDPKFFKGAEVVGVSPSVVMQKKIDKKGGNYTQLISEFIDDLIKTGHKVALIPHSVRKNTTKTHNNDLPLCNDIYKNLRSQKDCLFINDEISSQSLRAVIGACDLFVASRFHAMISSLSMEVPTLVLGWSHKYKEVLEMFDLEAYTLAESDLKKDKLIEKFKMLEENKNKVRDKISKNLPDVKNLASEQIEAINRIISS